MQHNSAEEIEENEAVSGDHYPKSKYEEKVQMNI